MGGLGLRAAEDQAPAAYAASLLASQPIVQSLVAPQVPAQVGDQPEQGVLDPDTLAALSAALGKPSRRGRSRGAHSANAHPEDRRGAAEASSRHAQRPGHQGEGQAGIPLLTSRRRLVELRPDQIFRPPLLST